MNVCHDRVLNLVSFNILLNIPYDLEYIFYYFFMIFFDMLLIVLVKIFDILLSS